MKNQPLLYIFVLAKFLLCAPSLFAQSVSGTLIDKGTEESIPFATVQLGQDYGVITNEEGGFSIITKKFNENDSIIFSIMGYDRKSIALKDFDGGKVYMKKNVEELDEVLLLNKKLTAEEIMLKVNENLAKNYNFSLSKFTVFNRSKYVNIFHEIDFEVKKAHHFIEKEVLRELNHTIDSLANTSEGEQSTYYDAFLSDVYIGKKDSVKVKLTKATKLINEEESRSSEKLQEKVFKSLLEKLKSANTFSVRTGIIPIEDSLKLEVEEEDDIDSLKTKWIGNRFERLLEVKDPKDIMDFGFINETNDYVYKIEDISTFNGELIYILSFVRDTGLFSGNGRYAGTLYISADSFAVVKLEYGFADDEHGTKVNLKFLLGVKFVEKQDSGIMIFERTETGRYVPKYIETHGGGYGYVSRNFVLKENDERQDRIKLKFDITMGVTNLNVEKWLFVSAETISEDDFANFQEDEGIAIEKVSEYNPEIWKDYNILSPSEAIREYE